MEPDLIAPTVAPAPVLPEPVAAPTPVSDEADFAAAFDALNTIAAPAAEPAPKAEPAPAAQAAAAEVAAVAPPAVEAAPEPVAPAPAAPTLEQQLATLRAENEALRHTAPAASAAAATPAAPIVEEAKPIFTSDEQKQLDAYLKEWPDVASSEALMRRRDNVQVVAHIYKQFEPLIAEVQALRALTGHLAVSNQYSEIVELVPDYPELRDPLLKWIDAQSPTIKTAYQQVGQNGTPSEIAELIGQFKKDTAWVAPAAAAPVVKAAAATPVATAPAAVPTKPAKPALAPAVAAAVAALKPVATARTDPAGSADPDDFDGAWAELTKTA